MHPAHRGAFFELLHDPALYLAAADRVRERHRERADERLLVEAGPSLSAVHDLVGLSKRLAREVGRGTYEIGPVVAHVVTLGGKRRTLFQARPLDEIVSTAIAALLARALEACLSERLFSYRSGRSSRAAIEQLADYVRAHAGARPDPRTRGLYVLRRDVSSYGDSIAAGEGSRLWTLLAEAIGPAEPAQLAWLRRAFRPALISEDGKLSLPTRGIPTGSALQPSACNLYLTPLDRLLDAIPGAFYARYGDDVVFAHPDAALVRAIESTTDRTLQELDLSPSANKCGAYYFNGAGRPSPVDPRFDSVTSLAYLGVALSFDGAVALKRDKCSALLRDLRQRLEQSATLLSDAAEPERTRALCAIANAALDPEHPSAHPSAAALLHAIDDRAFLRDLDHKLALSVAEVSTRRRGVRALRTQPPRRLRALGLRSLVNARNQAGRARA